MPRTANPYKHSAADAKKSALSRARTFREIAARSSDKRVEMHMLQKAQEWEQRAHEDGPAQATR